MSAPQDSVCADGHDFMEPVVVKVESSDSFLWFMMRDVLNREIAIVFCRRCGKQTMAGWTGTS